MEQKFTSSRVHQFINSMKMRIMVKFRLSIGNFICFSFNDETCLETHTQGKRKSDDNDDPRDAGEHQAT